MSDENTRALRDEEARVLRLLRAEMRGCRGDPERTGVLKSAMQQVQWEGAGFAECELRRCGERILANRIWGSELDDSDDEDAEE